MQIDDDVEPLVRSVFAAAIEQHPGRFDSSLVALTSCEDVTVRAVELATAVASAALLWIHEDTWPKPEQVTALAVEFCQTQGWARVSLSTAEAFIAALAEQKPPLQSLLGADAAVASFAVGGWLLSAFLPAADMRWNDFLDAVLDWLECEELPHLHGGVLGGRAGDGS